MSQRVVVVGGGRVGTALARLLLAGGHAVTVLDDRPKVLSRLREILPSGSVVPGGGANPASLEAAGIRTADALAAVMATDQTNVLACCLARFEYGVPRTIARVVDPALAWMYVPAMGVDSAVNQAELIAGLVAAELPAETRTGNVR